MEFRNESNLDWRGVTELRSSRALELLAGLEIM